ncbi:MAG: amidohydrolase family protein [Chitinophagales bacterium]
MKKIFFVAMITAGLVVQAQEEVPAPAAAQKERICIKGATIHVGNGTVIENGYLVFNNGVIENIFSAANVKTDATLGKVIDATGKHIYPGLIALNTVIGLGEIEAVRATNDASEIGGMTPEARAAIAYNTDSRVTPTVRTNGVLFAQAAPQNGRISGTSSVMQLDAWNWEDAIVKADDGIFMNWPSMFRMKGWWAQPEGYEVSKDYVKQVNELRQYFREAQAYASGSNTKVNLRFESMRGLFSGSKQLYIRVDFVKEILNAISFAEEMGLKPVIVGGKDSYQIADQLAQKKIPVIVSKAHDLPSYNDDDIQQPYKTPGMLMKAGVLTAISIDGFWQPRNLAFEAGTAATYGLTKEEALQLITANPAKIAGLSQLGTLEAGKSASFIISTGDVLDMRTSKIERAFIAGRDIDLDNKQTELYRKFSGKYGF